MDNKEIFSERLKELRSQTGKTQKQFAEFVESTPATISAYENATKNPSLEVVMNIARKCNVSLDWICGFSDEKGIPLNACADILKVLFELGLLDGIELESGFFKDTENNPLQIDPDPKYQHFMMIYFNDTTINDALIKWKKIFDLYQNQTIDEEVYRLWVEKTLKEYNIPYHPNKGVWNEFHPDSFENEMPFT